ncbi:MAG: CNNM domain-containing protein, partial [Actinomycetota bacterium]|nr:CNNM domain-containing protein [Actinomycetota bacterium]
MSILLGLVAVAVLLAVNAFFVAAEFSLVAVDRPRIEAAAKGADPQARRVQSLLGHLTLHLSGAQFGITLSALLLGFVAEPTVARILTGEAHLTGVSVTVAIAL